MQRAEHEPGRCGHAAAAGLLALGELQQHLGGAAAARRTWPLLLLLLLLLLLHPGRDRHDEPVLLQKWQLRQASATRRLGTGAGEQPAHQLIDYDSAILPFYDGGKR